MASRGDDRQPVGDRRRLEERVVEDDERSREQRREAPPNIGGARISFVARPFQGRDSCDRDQQRQRTESPVQRRDDDDEPDRLARRHLREPGDALLDHVPLQPVDARHVGREQAPLQRDARTGRNGALAQLNNLNGKPIQVGAIERVRERER